MVTLGEGQLSKTNANIRIKAENCISDYRFALPSCLSMYISLLMYWIQLVECGLKGGSRGSI